MSEEGTKYACHTTNWTVLKEFVGVIIYLDKILFKKLRHCGRPQVEIE
jgi:hypothetical protein